MKVALIITGGKILKVPLKIRERERERERKKEIHLNDNVIDIYNKT